MKALTLCAALFFASAAVPAWAADSSTDANRIVAVVNNEVITLSELHRALAPLYLQMQATLGPEELSKQMEDLQQNVLQQLIEERLMLQEARSPRAVEVSKGKIGTPPVIEASPEEVNKMLEEARGRFQSPEDFREALSQQGLTEEDLKSRFKDQIIVQKLISREVRSRVSVSPSEVTSYYESHKAQFITPEAVQVATILIRPKDSLDYARAYSSAQDLHRQLGQGADFYDLAGRYSDGFNAKMGGRIGILEKGKSRKEIDEVIFDLKAGQVSPVIRTPAGFHIFLIEAVRPPKISSLEEAQSDIRYLLLQEKAAARYRDWISRLRADSYISIK